MAEPSKPDAPRGAATVPDLYAWLGLQPLEGDRQKIEEAVRRCMSEARQVQAEDPQQAQRLAKIVELGNRLLLSEQRKPQYEPASAVTNALTQNTAVIASTTMVGAATATGPGGGSGAGLWGADADFAKLLPAGDPVAEFDLATFLEHSAVVDEGYLETEFHKLMGLLTTVDELPTAAASTLHVLAPAETESVSALRATAASSSATLVSGRSMAAKLRSRRERQLLTMVGGVLGSLAILLALVFYLLRPNDDTNLTALNNLDPNQPAAAAVPANGSRSGDESNIGRGGGVAAPQQGSGLPKVRGLDEPAGMGVGRLPGEDSDGGSSFAASEGMTIDNMQNNALEGSDGGLDIGLTMSEMTVDAASSSGAMMSGVEPLADVELTAEELQAWNESLVAIRGLLTNKNFAEARSAIVAAEMSLKAPAQREQLDRWRTLATLAEDFQKALEEAVVNLSAGEVFTVRSTPVSFVEGSPERLVVKVNGQMSTYNLVDIPIGMAFGLADLRLDLSSPITAARKAAFAALHPKQSELVNAHGKELMQAAIDGGVVNANMLQVFNAGEARK